MDNFSRKCLAKFAGKSLKVGDAVQMMDDIIFENNELPKRIRVDNESEFIGKVMDKWAYENKNRIGLLRFRETYRQPLYFKYYGSFKDDF